MIVAETLAVSNDEPCFLLAELNLQSPGSRGWHRYQVLTVVRNDRLAQATVDLGPREQYAAAEFRVLGGVQDEVTGKIDILCTVGELRDLADVQRSGGLPVPDHLLEPSDLLGAYHELRDRRRLANVQRSTFAAGGHLQRSA